jgi:hypothetical protein
MIYYIETIGRSFGIAPRSCESNAWDQAQTNDTMGWSIRRPEVYGTIPVDCVMMHDFLAQASFDASVDRVDFLSSYKVSGHHIFLDAIVVRQAGHAFGVDFHQARSPRDVDEERLALIALSELGLEFVNVFVADVEMEPRYSNAREVCCHRNESVSMVACINVVAAIEAAGALSMRQLAKIVDVDLQVTNTVYALACSGFVNLDLKQRPLGPGTIATRGYKRAEPAV